MFFGIQTEIAEKVVSQLRAKLSPQEKAAIQERPTQDLTAYDLYLRPEIWLTRLLSRQVAAKDLAEATRFTR